MRLTRREKDAVLSVLVEREAAGVEDLADAFGVEDDEAERMMDLLASAARKIRKDLTGGEG